MISKPYASFVLISAGLGFLVEGRDCRGVAGRLVGSSSSEEPSLEEPESGSPSGRLGEPTMATRSAFRGLVCVWRERRRVRGEKRSYNYRGVF